MKNTLFELVVVCAAGYCIGRYVEFNEWAHKTEQESKKEKKSEEIKSRVKSALKVMVFGKPEEK